MIQAIHMIKAIAKYSNNELCATLCKQIINGDTTIEKELSRNHGSFFVSVLNGDYSTALRRADFSNANALLKVSEFTTLQ